MCFWTCMSVQIFYITAYIATWAKIHKEIRVCNAPCRCTAIYKYMNHVTNQSPQIMNLNQVIAGFGHGLTKIYGLTLCTLGVLLMRFITVVNYLWCVSCTQMAVHLHRRRCVLYLYTFLPITIIMSLTIIMVNYVQVKQLR